ncbi:MAG TPA: branched-chain amino acid ABC transporter permease [bacterium]|nr:branched-chain amino acid ABC transporter permease [bacterium]
MAQLAQLLIGGIIAGGIYGSLALALVIINRSTRIVNFAQGEMAALTTLLAWSLLRAQVPYWLTFFAVLVIAFALGFGVERLIVRRFELTSTMTAVVATLGLYTLINGGTQFVWGGDIKTFPSPFPAYTFPVGSVAVSVQYLGTIGILLAVMAATYVLFEKTHLGLVMRAAAMNRSSAELAGVNVGLMLELGWGLATLIGAVAGLLIAPITMLGPNIMVNVLIYAFAAAILGGFESQAGAVVGGLVVGVGENLLRSYVPFIGNDLSLPAVLALIMVVLLVRPQGLFGRRSVTRV